MSNLEYTPQYEEMVFLNAFFMKYQYWENGPTHYMVAMKTWIDLCVFLQLQ